MPQQNRRRAVYDLESARVPTFIGWYVGTDEDAVLYLRADGRIVAAPVDCVEIAERARRAYAVRCSCDGRDS